MLDISVIVLAGEEELHIARCLSNVAGLVKDVFVVDSFSRDRTVEIVNAFCDTKGTRMHVVQHAWPGLYAPQFNWALDNLPIQTEWVLRLDADEYLTLELVDEIMNRIGGLPETVTGVVFPLRRVFLGKVIRHGMPEVKLLRLFRYGRARCELRMMDEHIQLLEGHSVEFDGHFCDHNLNNLSWWTQKHVGYAIREAADLLDIEYGLAAQQEETKKGEGANIGTQASAKRTKKGKYAQLPLFWRAALYFVYRYIVRGGFLEGKEAFLWHFLQGWWYRTLVDAKILEVKKRAHDIRQQAINHNKEIALDKAIVTVLCDEYGIKI